MRGRCAGAIFIGVGKLYDYRFIINTRGVATLVSDLSHVVFGLLWEINPHDEKLLDDYEGVSHNSYYKSEVTVKTEGPEVEAMIYLANDERMGSPYRGYLELIVAAADVHGFPNFYVKELRQWFLTQD